MGRNIALVVGGIVLGIVVLAAVSVSLGSNGPDAEPASTPSGFPVTPATADPAPTAPEVPDRGPNGMPIEDEADRELRGEGLLTPRPVDAEGERWSAKRREQNDAWVRQTLATTEAFVTEKVSDPAAQAGVRAAIQTFTNDISRTRAAMANRTIRLADGRAAMAASRNRVAEEVAAAVGTESAEALRARLAAASIGGGW